MKKNRVYRFHEDLEIALTRFSRQLLLLRKILINDLLPTFEKVLIQIGLFLQFDFPVMYYQTLMIRVEPITRLDHFRLEHDQEPLKFSL